MTTSSVYHRRGTAAQTIEAQVAAIRHEREHRPTLTQLGAALDGLNAWDAVERVRRAGYSPLLSAGPKVCECVPFLGLRDCHALGVVFWHRAAGYHGYKVLSVHGVWVCQQQGTGETRLVVGEKNLPFAPAFFDPEPYHKLFKRDYTTYYRDDGMPPAHDRVQTVPYAPDHRLDLRAWLAAALA